VALKDPIFFIDQLAVKSKEVFVLTANKEKGKKESISIYLKYVP